MERLAHLGYLLLVQLDIAHCDETELTQERVHKVHSWILHKDLLLLVEDEPDLNETISFNLDSEGYEVTSTFNGKDALNAIEKKKPDLILLDLMLPDMSGLEICRELRSSKKTKKIPIMMVTAKGEEVDRIVGFELGADDYIVKPFSIREFMLRVSAMLKRTSCGCSIIN